MILWTSRSDNVKTGNVPTGWVGASHAESVASCLKVKCPLLPATMGGPAKKGEPRCYAHCGSPRIGYESVRRAADEGQDRSIGHALENRHKSARMVRVGAIGDPGATRDLVSATIRAVHAAWDQGLSVVGYTHGWRRKVASRLRGVLMASCDTVEQADEAVAQGWRAAVVVPSGTQGRFTTPAGNRGIVCPAMTSKGKVTCNDCRLCDASKAGPIIAFPDHGPGSELRRGKHGKT